MCGRFVRESPRDRIARLLDLGSLQGDMRARYNITPGQAIENVQLRLGRASIETYRWGFVPVWARAEGIKSPPINAKAETVATNGMFRHAFRHGRSIIPADGFYEWQAAGGQKVPHYIFRKDGEPLWFAGIYDHWKQCPDDSTYLSCAIITCPPNDFMQPIHARMPVILSRADVDAWLDLDTPPESAEALLRPCPPQWLDAYPVSTAVNRPSNDSPDLIRPAD